MKLDIQTYTQNELALEGVVPQRIKEIAIDPLGKGRPIEIEDGAYIAVLKNAMALVRTVRDSPHEFPYLTKGGLCETYEKLIAGTREEKKLRQTCVPSPYATGVLSVGTIGTAIETISRMVSHPKWQTEDLVWRQACVQYGVMRAWPFRWGCGLLARLYATLDTDTAIVIPHKQRMEYAHALQRDIKTLAAFLRTVPQLATKDIIG